MKTISEIAQQAFESRYLTLEAENELRQRLARQCPPDEVRSFMNLQIAVLEGKIKQEARELLLV